MDRLCVELSRYDGLLRVVMPSAESVELQYPSLTAIKRCADAMGSGYAAKIFKALITSKVVKDMDALNLWAEGNGIGSLLVCAVCLSFCFILTPCSYYNLLS